MFQGIKNGWEICRVSFRELFRYPKLLVPLLITWLCYGCATLYFSYFFEWNEVVTDFRLFLIFVIILFCAFLLSLSCSMLLELIEQQESGKAMSLVEAFLDTIGLNLFAMIPLAVLWGGVWFILLILEILFSRFKRRKDEDQELTAENAARTLTGDIGAVSLSSTYFKAMKKGFRMAVFLILPGIAWENLGFRKAYQRGRLILGLHLEQFISGFLVTEGAALLIFLPAAMVFFLSGVLEIQFPEWVRYITIGYLWAGWSLVIYLEQMFTAELYLWHMRWEREMLAAEEAGRRLPRLTEIKLPDLLDQTPDLLKMQMEDFKKKQARIEKAQIEEIRRRLEG
ncbi:MAG TPA: hypothetical protein VHY08_27340 [Bacillota bacterium]|nr:hypothetical protein [Bacillota bacterium]